MANPIYNLFNRKPQNNMLAQFQQFRNSFKGDPKQQVQELLNSGKMSQEQFTRLSQMANEMRSLLKYFCKIINKSQRRTNLCL